jgi:hypothetical protein
LECWNIGGSKKAGFLKDPLFHSSSIPWFPIIGVEFKEMGLIIKRKFDILM